MFGLWVVLCLPWLMVRFFFRLIEIAAETEITKGIWQFFLSDWRQ